MASPKINTEVIMERGRLILNGMSIYETIKYTKTPERTTPGNVNREL